MWAFGKGWLENHWRRSAMKQKMCESLVKVDQQLKGNISLQTEQSTSNETC